MSKKKHFKCVQCEGHAEAAPGEDAPQCCGQAMVENNEPMEQCTLSSTAEHSRMDDMGEPCDDGRAGS